MQDSLNPFLFNSQILTKVCLPYCGYLIKGSLEHKVIKLGDSIEDELIIISRYGCKNTDKPKNLRGLDDRGNVSNFLETEMILNHKDWQETQIFSAVFLSGDPPCFFKQTMDEAMNTLSSRDERLRHIHDKFYDKMEKSYNKTFMIRVNVDKKFCPNSHNANIENHEQPL